MPPGAPSSTFSPCVICLSGTDAVLIFSGRPEWVLAGTQMLGFSLEQTELMLQAAMGWPAGMVPDIERIDVTLRVCETCAEAHRFTVGVPPAVPVHRQPRSDERPSG
jgi:hypothetical protein